MRRTHFQVWKTAFTCVVLWDMALLRLLSSSICLCPRTLFLLRLPFHSRRSPSSLPKRKRERERRREGEKTCLCQRKAHSGHHWALSRCVPGCLLVAAPHLNTPTEYWFRSEHLGKMRCFFFKKKKKKIQMRCVHPRHLPLVLSLVFQVCQLPREAQRRRRPNPSRLPFTTQGRGTCFLKGKLPS